MTRWRVGGRGGCPSGTEITLRQLLTHTGGIFDNNDAVKDPARVLARSRTPVAGGPQ
jgi:CubicO group peptidase (beta-lactamase class C family)